MFAQIELLFARRFFWVLFSVIYLKTICLSNNFNVKKELTFYGEIYYILITY